MAKGFKTGGRIRGTPNKRTASVMEVLARNEFDPIQELLNLYKMSMNSGEPASTALRCLEALLPYCYPKVGAANTDVDIFLLQRIENLSLKPKEELIEIVEAEIKKLRSND